MVSRLRAFAALVCVSLYSWPVGALADEPVQRTALRVCADPANLPLSDRNGDGFENRIAALLGDKLGLPVTYSWWPNTIGFIRNTLRAKKCDIVMGVVEGFEHAATTRPYYRSSYVMVTRAENGDPFTGLGDAAVRGAAIGAVAGTPPVDLLVKRDLLSQLRPYGLVVDTRVERPAQRMVEDVANGAIDIALVWGPIGGYYARQQTPPLKVTMLESEAGDPPLEFSIAAAVRHGELEWKNRIDSLLTTHRDEIEAILAEHGVPLLDNPTMAARQSDR